MKTGDEDNVKERIKFKLKDQFNIFVPKRKLREMKNGIWCNKLRILFPGYVILKGEMNNKNYYMFKEIPGVINILKSDTSILMIGKDEVQVISKLVSNGDILVSSRAVSHNGKIKILDGPLKTLEGSIVSINKRRNRAKVNINFMGELRTVELGLTIVKFVDV